ncbi:MAG: LicD family protein [Bacteroidaceae bacterium]|nr:LicD family protein [Bacteroidaceae bacterium]
MRDRIPFWIIELAHKVSKIPFAKKLLKPFYYPYKIRIEKRRNINFKAYALDALRDFDACMIENGFNYSLTFGSLLGAIREKGFISHDLDIDVMIFAKERTPLLQKCLESVGFRLFRRFSLDDASLGCEESYLYKDTGVSLDIFFIYPAIDNYPYVCCWNNFPDCSTCRESVRKHGGVIPRRIELPIDHQVCRVQFENIKVNIPMNAHQILEFSYGSDYMIPNPNYTVPKEHRYIWKEKIAICEEF